MANRQRFRSLGLALSLLFAACTAHKAQRTTEGAPVEPADAGRDAAPLPVLDASDSVDPVASTDAGECSSVSRAATTRQVPVDILFIIDNSPSMDEEILAVRQHINDDFAKIIADSGVDYRVIMVSSYRDLPAPNTFVCIDPPLSGRACDGVDEPFVTNGERFFHFSVDIGSLDGWCRLLDSLEQPDHWAFNDWLADPHEPEASRPDWQTKFPHGIQELLRQEAFKSIVLISDDAVVCESKRAYDVVGRLTDGPPDAHGERFLDSRWDRFVFPKIPDREEVVAGLFDRALTARAPEQFGTPDNRNYRFHAIVGLDAAGALQPDRPLVDKACATAENAGRSHQALSRLTGGLRYPICHIDSYDEIFHALAHDSIASSRLPCHFEIPAPPPGQSFGPGLVNVEYKREGQPTRVIPRAADAAHCAGQDAWFYDDNADPKSIVMCPNTCSELSAAQNGSVHIALGCETVVL